MTFLAVKSCKINQDGCECECEAGMSLTGVQAEWRSAWDSKGRVQSVQKDWETLWEICARRLWLYRLAHVWSHWGNDHKQAAELSFYALALARNESMACSNKPTLFFTLHSGSNSMSAAAPGCPQAALGRTPDWYHSSISTKIKRRRLHGTGSQWSRSKMMPAVH